MAKKNMKTAKKQKNGAVRADINALHVCISKDQDQLEKLYNKTVISANKTVLAAKKSLAKAKKLAVKTKRHKKSAPKAYQGALSEVQSLQKQLEVLKSEYAFIEAGYTKFNAQQKALINFEKEWKKKTASVKKKPKKQRKMVTEKAVVEVSQLS